MWCDISATYENTPPIIEPTHKEELSLQNTQAV